jgi:hypothetical protein
VWRNVFLKLVFMFSGWWFFYFFSSSSIDVTVHNLEDTKSVTSAYQETTVLKYSNTRKLEKLCKLIKSNSDISPRHILPINLCKLKLCRSRYFDLPPPIAVKNSVNCEPIWFHLCRWRISLCFPQVWQSLWKWQVLMWPQILNFHIMFFEIRFSGFSYLAFIMNNQLYLSVSQHEISLFLIASRVSFQTLETYIMYSNTWIWDLV